MSQLTAGPCTPWVPIGCGTFDPSATAITGTMLAAASHILWAKSGRQFGECQVTIRPCRRDCYGAVWPFGRELGYSNSSQWPYPYWWDGQWFNLGCGGCPGTCSCTVLQEVMLPYPVSTVDSIKIDGVALTPLSDHVMLYDYQRLVRTDGEMWPLCNDLSQPDTEANTWSITVTAGVPVPPLGQIAVGELLTQLVRACLGNDCVLPTNVQQIVRQGITLTPFDPNIVFADGKIGLFYSDLFISTTNPGGVSTRARLYDPDARGPTRQTWPP